MEQLHFTTRVLGNKAASRLEQHELTQTMRSEASSIVLAILGGGLKVSDAMQVILDDRMMGLAELLRMDTVTWGQLDIEDARRGGFDNRFELAHALKRAGYRFMPLDKYQFYRCRFSWLEEDEP